MSIEKTERIFGLDLLRCAAILIVTISHTKSPITQYYPSFPLIPLPDGVDLFFVLSGFLIGNILIKTIQQSNVFSVVTLSHFMKRRWLRTLPNYFLFLFVNALLINANLITGQINKYIITYVIFFQNFYKPFDFLFWESWSLSVEEWFYILFPFLLYSLIKIKLFSTKKAILISILLFLILPLGYRLGSNAFLNPYAQWDLYYRKLVLTRLDSIGFGLLAAFVFNYYPVIWYKFKNSSFIVGLILIGCLLLFQSNFSMGFMKTFFFSVMAFSIALLLPTLNNLKNEPIKFKPVAFISKISYSMYLVQIPLFQIFSNYFNIETKLQSVSVYFGYWLALILISALVYQYYEKYFLKLRDKQ